MQLIKTSVVLASLLATSFCFSAQPAPQHNTKKVLLEINDPKAKQNPVKSIEASRLKAVDVRNRLKPKPNQDVAVICEGDFPAGMIAEDLYSMSGGFRRTFDVTQTTTILDLCHQLEDHYRKVSPKNFK
ncbi:hypothetical protein LZ683_10480 [Comamonas testosteroni]|uniref:hypothetical protein n=1 Tax=Comamonas testosteroni TaxID=285 RepID=UPI0023AAF0C3|nr:hypothetical protein [Comamonas testosteroni]WEE79749.1 hypothetical protein LZ683_10480 [Comamonas testosteroni]